MFLDFIPAVQQLLQLPTLNPSFCIPILPIRVCRLFDNNCTVLSEHSVHQIPKKKIIWILETGIYPSVLKRELHGE